jgi:hypothetical protein
VAVAHDILGGKSIQDVFLAFANLMDPLLGERYKGGPSALPTVI